MSLSIIKTHKTNTEVVLDEGADERQKSFLVKADTFQSVESQEAQDLAVNFCQNLKTELDAVEEIRTNLKAPHLDIGRKIDKIAKEYSAPIIAAQKRIAGLISGFRTKEEERVRKEEQAKADELRKLQEQLKQAELDAAKKHQTEPPAADEEAAILAANRAASDSDALEEKRSEIMAVALATPTVAKSEGMISRKIWKYEITDAKKVAEKFPHFFEMVEKKSIINATIGPDFQCEGMRVWSENSVSFRR